MSKEENKKHLDPPRYPKLIEPIEEGMKREFKVVMKKLVIDITKQLTKEIKNSS